MSTERTKLIQILRQLLAKEIDVVEAQDQVYALKMTEFGYVFANLHHYFIDDGKRVKDEALGQFLDVELKKLIFHLEAGDMQAADNVSFLRASPGI